MDPVAGAEEDQARRDSLESESGNMVVTQEQEGFFNLLTHVQGARIDEQRCSIQIVHSKGESDEKDETQGIPPPEMNLLMDMLAQSQSRRLDDQRADFIQSTGFPDTMPTRRLSNDNGALKNKA
ncbi:Purkinje cell protein 2 homolog isoform 2-T2 [Gastrophryne carolinensis]